MPQNIEALKQYGQIARVNPAIMQIAGDLIVKAMDWDGANGIAERLKKCYRHNCSKKKAKTANSYRQLDEKRR